MRKKNNYTGERLETSIYGRDAIDHLHRYAVAIEYCKDKIVLDIASGEGYGSNLLSKQAKKVYGVDISQIAIDNSKSNYKSANLEFLLGSTDAIPLADSSVDVVVSFETIEHHDKHELMLSEIKRVLKPDGIVIISTPDKLYYSDLRKFDNKFHVKELYKEDFLQLLNNHFKNVQLLLQKYINGNSLLQDVGNEAEFKFYTGDYTEVGHTELHHLYLVVIVSNGIFTKQRTSIFEGSNIIKIQQKQRENYIYQSTTFRIGVAILRPMRFLKAMFSR